MTKFITYYSICSIPEPKDFLGISPDKDDGNIITTLGKNIIIIIKISTQKQIRSWSVLEKLSSKVVYDKISEKYVAVFANKHMRCWDESATDINKCKKLKFQKSIANLVNCGEDTLVLYSDGSCELLAAAIQSRKEDISNSAQQLELSSRLLFSNPSVHCLPNGNRILTYFERNNTNSDYYLVRLSLAAEVAEAPKRFKLSRGNLNVNVAGAAVIEGDGQPMLLTVWSDKRIFLLSLGDETLPERSPGNFVSMLTQLKVDSPLSIIGISKHFVAIYGANHGQEGASLLLYNTQYKVIKTKQFFKVYFNVSQLWSISDHIILAMGQNLSVVKYRVLKEVLSELVGTQVSNDYKMPIEIDHINEEDVMEQYLQYSADFTSYQDIASEKSTLKSDSKIEEADGLTVPFVGSHDFDKELNLLKQMNLHVDVVSDDSPLENVQITLMSNYNDNGFICPEIQLIARQLERAGVSEHEITEKLLTVLTKANLIQDIGVCLRRYTNISEKMLSKTLNFILKKYKKGTNGIEISSEDEPATEQQNEHMEVEVSLNSAENESYPNIDLLAENYPQSCNATEIKDILNIVLSCSFDADTIALNIRKDVEYSEIIILLQHLYDALTSKQPQAIEQHPTLYETSVDFELQLLRWFGVVLNSHFQKLALSKDVNLIELLFKWHELFQSYKHEIAELENVSALLYNIMEKKTAIKEKGSSRWYSIEEVYLF